MITASGRYWRAKDMLSNEVQRNRQTRIGRLDARKFRISSHRSSEFRDQFRDSFGIVPQKERSATSSRHGSPPATL
jgi:hypothetical protein